MQNLFYPKSLFAKISKFEPKHWWFISRLEILIWAFQKKLSPFSSFLEVGCGTGFILKNLNSRFPLKQLAGVEYYQEALQIARQNNPTLHIAKKDALKMTDRNKWDIIGAFDVLEHIEQDTKVLTNFKRALKSKGKIILTVPQHSWLWSKSDENAFHVRRYSQKDLRRKMLHAGFQVEYQTSFCALLLPLMWMVRILKKNVDENPLAEFQISSFLNRILLKIMFFENLLIRLGCSFPAGGSLLLIGKKI